MLKKHTSRFLETRSRIRAKRNTNDLIYQKKITKNMINMLNNLKKFKTFYKKLSKEKKDVLVNYKGNGYININSYLYNNLKIKDFEINNAFIANIKSYFSDNTKSLIDLKSINPGNIKTLLELYVNKNIIEKINTIDEILKDKDIPKLVGNEILFRGTKEHTLTTNKSKVGDIVVSKSYISTSTEQEISENFTYSWNKNQSNLCCMHVLHGLKDVPYIYIPWGIKKAHNYEQMHILQSYGDEFEYMLPRGMKFRITKIENKIIRKAYSSIKKISFSKLDKLISTTKKTLLNSGTTKKLNNNNVRNIFNKTNLRIKTFHLEYVEQEVLEKIPNYSYEKSANIHITPILEDDTTSKSTKLIKNETIYV